MSTFPGRRVWASIPYDLCLIDTPKDGSCLFHAICNAFYKPYRLEIIQGRKVSRSDIVALFRSELADMLSVVVPGTDMIYYQYIGNGHIKDLGDTVDDYTLSGLQSWLKSSSNMGDEIVTYIEHVIGKNLLFLDTRTEDVYIRKSCETNNNPCIIMFYDGGHYDLCGIKERDGSTSTHFAHDHPFVSHIMKRLQS